MRTIRESLRLKRSETLTAKPDQGRAMECVAADLASTHFIKSGDFTRFADWRFIHRARLNLVPLNGSSSWRTGDRRCRRCGYTTESLSHVVDHCMRYTALYMARHNSIVARIKKAAGTRFQVIAENTTIGTQKLRPDLVIKRGKTVLIIDVTVPFDNRMAAFEVAARSKKEKYEQLRAELASEHGAAEVVPFIVGALGSWDPNNNKFMRQLCSRKYGDLMRKLCVSDTIRSSRNIYIEHITGAFDKVWHKGFLIKLREQLPHTWCALLESYLTDRQFRVIHEEAVTEWKNISAGVPQGSVLGPILYLLYTADIPNNDNNDTITTAMFADDTAILSTSKNQLTATDNLQASINNIFAWTRRWKIKINGDKSVHVNYTLRKTENIPILLNQTLIPQKDSAKYLGMHLDSRLNWKHHVRQKKIQVKEKIRKLYWLVGPHSELTIENKRLLYVAIIKPIWTYGIQLWGCASKSNIDIIQR
ncbi:Reverse transcriptase domain [Cinara cedri]|uniref:Reverse transcriptase domain n=1 Tax=Cinara cedri TaxID=506608 RepID=A0A5E4MYT8_9HEMI|nr:Reverse transcriptase domain [Cinara cedri]